MSNITKTDTFMASLGVECYRVGGSVRDELLGKAPKDADYMVRGISLADLAELLEGQSHEGRVSPMRLRQGGTFGFRYSRKGMFVEIALPRTEYLRPASPEDTFSGNVRGRMEVMVDPTLSLEEDAKRRDFTFNALYKRVDSVTGVGVRSLLATPSGSHVYDIFDPTGRGLFDLERGYIATTHPDSFVDDPLRMLRALRFVARGFTLSTETRNQMIKHAKEVDGLTAHGYTSGTLFDELRKIMEGDHAVDALREARDTGVLAVAIPELAPMIGFDQGSRYHDLTTDEHTFKALETAVHVDAPLRVRLALLFHDAGKPEAAWVGKDGRKHYYSHKWGDDGQDFWTEDHEVVGVRIWREFCARVNVGREMREDVATLIKHHMLTASPKGSRVRRMRVKLGDEMLRNLIMHRMCDITGKTKPPGSALAQMAKWERIRMDAQRDGIPANVKSLKITGKDVMEVLPGVEGQAIGEVLRDVLDEIVCQPTAEKLTREWQYDKLHMYI